MNKKIPILNLRKSDIESMERIYRLNLINSVSGYKSANLIGTRSGQGQSNLSIVSSVIHLSSSPAIIGFMQRPASVPRHSYENIKESGSYTINHIHAEFTDRAHYTSAKFSREESEFEAAGLTEVYLEDFPAPFVKESTIKLGMSFLEEYQIRASSTILIVGQVELISLPSNLVKSNGQIDLDEASSVAISGLNNYHQAKMIASYPYAKPGIFPVNSLKSS